MRSQKKSLTLAGLLVIAGIAGAYVIPLLPAVQQARLANARSECQNTLEKVVDQESDSSERAPTESDPKKSDRQP